MAAEGRPAAGPALRPPGERNDGPLPLRVASAALLAPPFLAAAYMGGWLFVALVCALIGIATWEYWRMALERRRGCFALAFGIGLAAAARFVFSWGPAADGALIALAVAGALVLGLGASEPGRGVRVAALTLLGGLYVGWLFSYLIGLRELPRVLPGASYRAGFVLVAAPLVLVWASDIGAYFAGRHWGGRRLLPHVSPGKTVAGAVGGVGLCAGVAAVLFAWAPAPLPRAGAAGGFAIGLAASLLAQMGDLAESLLKRAFEVKDSSRLIPGHGGVLDRFDALLFAAPAAYYFFRAAIR